MNALDRFFAKIKREDGHWLWTAYLDEDGYGQFRDEDSKKVYAHRFAYEYFIRPIPKNKVVDHKCRTRHCVNPTHLRIVSKKKNVLENSVSIQAANSVKTLCLHGHNFDTMNTGVDKRGDRYCKQCARDRSKARYSRLSK